jgi:LmbE family N-acetylglucosaminyl deacetylase
MDATGHDLGTVLGVWAHPDDETYLCAGLMARARDAGDRVVSVSATRGERGTDDPTAWPPERLGPLRETELAAALAVLGVTEHRFLGHPDGGCDDVDEDAAVAQVRAVIEEVRPDAILTFGPDGITGHPDHQAVSRWTTRAWREVGGPARLLHAVVTVGYATRFEALHQRIGAFEPGYPVVVADERCDVHLLLEGAELDRKLAALRAQASQTAALERSIGPATYAEWSAEEAFVEILDHPTRLLPRVGEFPTA